MDVRPLDEVALDEGKCDGEGCLTFKPQYFCHYYMLLIVLVCCIEVAPVDFSKPPLSPLTISWEAVAYITTPYLEHAICYWLKT